MQDGSEARLKNNTGNETNWKKQLAWSLVFVVIAAASVWAVASQSRGFSLAAFGEFIRGASLPWLAAAILCMLIYIYAEGVALNCICASFSCRMRRRDGFVYASADIYFSAITPSATGGQPASAYFMIQDGIPGPTATVALLVNLCMYTLSIIFIGAFCFIVRPNIYASFSLAPRLLILLGCVVQVGLVVIFAMLLRHEKWVERLGSGVIRLLTALHLVRHPEARREKLKMQIQHYKQDAALVFGRGNGAGFWQRGALFLLRAQRCSLRFYPVRGAGPQQQNGFPLARRVYHGGDAGLSGDGRPRRGHAGHLGGAGLRHTGL